MKRSLASLILIFASASCDDSDPASAVAQNRATEGDSSTPVVDSGAVGSGPAELKVRVTNAGEPCELLSRDCHGSAPQCMEISPSGAIYAGGYCTSDCKRSAECGPGAECPVAEAALVSPDYAFRSTWARKCFRSCRPGVIGECRLGYECTSLAQAYDAPDAPAPMQRTTCLPKGPGGASSPASDAGTVTLHGIDGGH
jgi:hypothetical protein